MYRRIVVIAGVEGGLSQLVVWLSRGSMFKVGRQERGEIPLIFYHILSAPHDFFEIKPNTTNYECEGNYPPSG